jgi:hypothetical protein
MVGQGSRIEPDNPAEKQAKLQQELAFTDRLIQSASAKLAVYQQVLANLERDRDLITAALATLAGSDTR